MSGTWMLYGANGYTGELIAEEAARRGMKPILAGRREDAVRAVAERTGLEMRIFPLEEVRSIKRELHDVDVVLHCAGPFSITSAPMVEACLETGKHYLDITGEIGVFEACHSHHRRAQRVGSIIMPGVGFDVVPSDCLAAMLAQAMPEAVFLEMAFHSESTMSAGTMKTMIEGFTEGGKYRRDGVIRGFTVGDPEFSRTIPFRDKPRDGMAIPWGDVSTAYYSTDIPNIVIYYTAPPSMARMLKMTSRLAGGLKPFIEFLQKQVQKRVDGPSKEQRETLHTQLWGRVRDADGRTVEATLVTPEGYHLTVLTALEATRRVLEEDLEPGALTPSLAFGPDFILDFEGCDVEGLE